MESFSIHIDINCFSWKLTQPNLKEVMSMYVMYCLAPYMYQYGRHLTSSQVFDVSQTTFLDHLWIMMISLSKPRLMDKCLFWVGGKGTSQSVVWSWDLIYLVNNMRCHMVWGSGVNKPYVLRFEGTIWGRGWHRVCSMLHWSCRTHSRVSESTHRRRSDRLRIPTFSPCLCPSSD